MAGESWSGSLKAMGMSHKQIRRQTDWVGTRAGFIIVYPPCPGLVSANWTDNKRFYNLPKHQQQLGIRQMSV